MMGDNVRSSAIYLLNWIKFIEVWWCNISNQCEWCSNDAIIIFLAASLEAGGIY